MTILILQRGWVVIGEGGQEAGEWRLSDAAVIRRWGTTTGVGQLALDGPQSETVADPCGSIRAHELTVVLAIDVQPEAAAAWRRRLNRDAAPTKPRAKAVR